DGEIWTATLWDLRKALVARYGATQGAEVAARLVTDGMPLTAPDPSFLGARAHSNTGDDTDPTPAFDHPSAAKNGTVALTLVNATTGQPINNAKVILGRFEARVTPLVRTGSAGGASVKALAG